MDPTPTDNGKPLTPADADPAAPQSLSGWFRQNAVQLVVVIAIIAAVCNYLHPLDVLLAGFGLSLIIFIHELGHFLAAKWCDVHVKTFSIGFGPALPFCQFKYGETTYKLAMIPLGGYVAMVGEGDQEGDVVEAEDDPERAAADPRNFKNKSVLHRMLIISAGVIMNVLLGAVVFTVTYLHGVEEQPAVVARVEPGSAAWRAGLRVGTEIKAINNRQNPFFDDIRPLVMSTNKGEQVRLEVVYKGDRKSLAAEPVRQEGSLFPTLGIAPPDAMTLWYVRRDDTPPYAPDSPAAAATAADGGPGFLPGDRIVALTDPDNPEAVTPLRPNWDGLPGPFFDYNRRMIRLTGKPVTYQVVRREDASNTPVAVTVAPAYRWDTGLRMRMGAVAAVRRDSPAERAGVQARQTDGDKVLAPGDRIIAVEVTEPDGSVIRFAADPNPPAGPGKVTVRPLDPLHLPDELDAWADRKPADMTVRLTVLRVGEGEHTEKPVPLTLEWDPTRRYDRPSFANPGTPVAVEGLGLAYHVQAVVGAVTPGSPAAVTGLRPDDKVVEVRFKARDHKGKLVTGDWEEVRDHHWAFVDYTLQVQAPHEFDARVRRGDQTIEVTLSAVEVRSWPVPDRGLRFMPETQTQRADGVLDALAMGADRTARTVKVIYLGLYSMVFGRTSVKLMSGPLSLARFSYLIAGKDVWHLLLWMGLISINLAVVNFLPVPVLDGGHMVFLTYEWVRGKPAPVWAQEAATYVGLAVIASLMLFVIGLDIYRLFIA